MAVLWGEEIDGVRYEVRSAGYTRRLYTDGVFHSELNLRRVVTGGIWDLLTLPALMPPPGTIRRALVLGVGGGAVLRQLLHFLAPQVLVGVELNPVHLRLARRFFGLRDRRFELVQADARRWLTAYRGPRFDLIVDDVFGEQDGEPVRAVAADRPWFETLLRHLSPDGVLAMNFISPAELRHSAFFSSARIRGRFAAGFELVHPLNENAIGAFLRGPGDNRTLRRQLMRTPELDPRRKTCRLRYRIRRLPSART